MVSRKYAEGVPFFMDIKERTIDVPSVNGVILQLPPGGRSVTDLRDVTVSDLVQMKTTEPPFHVHHAIVGAAIAGASLLVFFIPDLKPTTKYIVAGLGVSIGVALVYDDLVQHMENECDFSSIINFVPCEKKVVKKVLAPTSSALPLPVRFSPETLDIASEKPTE